MQTLKDREGYSIASRDLSAVLSPEMGGRLLQLKYRDSVDIVVPMAPHRFNVLHWPRAGAYPLIPYHNRLANASISIAKQDLLLLPHPAAKPHSLHGPSHTRPWRAVSHAPNRFIMEIDYDADPHWPWRFSAQQDFYLQDNSLTVRISLTNLGSRPMPAGFGWHPYFASTEQPETDAMIHWPHREDYLPSGERAIVMDRKSLEQQDTSYLGEWNSATIRLKGARVVMFAPSPFDFLVVHRGDAFHVCIEPVTHVANAWNLDMGAASVGARVLQPGEVLEGRIELTVS
ncbi:aldose 1-epimerase [Tardiphaga robiniae]|uniref:Aldose 1-epimerase n=1 Tax=Tardiphaga robiniae TaxID=943830 RepID=A0A7G6U1I2_9BRAD|nr:aldose 1-epimerase [Tardiphaga robiniae]QND72864.1 aldose 1-epimerase [Tardiphaga robiniae]